MKFIPKGYDGLTMTQTEANAAWRKDPGYINGELSQYDLEKMYQYWLHHKNEFNWDPTANPEVSTEGLFGSNAKRNDTGYKSWNEWFNGTGFNKFFGWNADVADYFGPSTSARKQFLDYFTEREKKTPKTPETPKREPTPYKPFKFTPNTDPKTKTPWSDWLPLTAQYASDLYTSRKTQDLDADKKFSKEHAPLQQYLMNDNFFNRSMYKNQADQIRSDATQMMGSNAEYNMAVQQNAERQAQRYEQEADKIQADTLASERQQFNKVINNNKAIAAEYANYNNRVDAAAYNNLLNAKKTRLATDNSNRQSYINNMYTSLTNKVQNDRLNENAKKRADALLQYNEYRRNAFTKYEKDSEMTNWAGLGTAYNAMMTSPDLDSAIQAKKWSLTYDPKTWNAEQQAALEQWFETSAGASYKAAYDKWKKQQLDAYNAATQGAYNGYQQVLAGILPYPSNQLDLNFFPDKRQTITVKKSGGKVTKKESKIDKFYQYARLYQKELNDIRKDSQTTHQRLDRKLERDLNSIDRETLMLLKQLFK